MTAVKWCLLAFGLVLPGLSGCGPSGLPDVYADNRAPQTKVERGIIVGVRRVGLSAARMIRVALDADGGIAGPATEPTSADTVVSEYIVRKPNGSLISVIQTDKVALVLGQSVLVIAGDRAHLMSDHIESSGRSGALHLHSSN